MDDYVVKKTYRASQLIHLPTNDFAKILQDILDGKANYETSYHWIVNFGGESD